MDPAPVWSFAGLRPEMRQVGDVRPRVERLEGDPLGGPGDQFLLEGHTPEPGFDGLAPERKTGRQIVGGGR